MNDNTFAVVLNCWIAFTVVTFATGHWIAGIVGGGMAVVMFLDTLSE